MPRVSNELGVPRTLTPMQVRERFGTILAERRYIGVRNFAAELLLEPRNPFQQTTRKPKKWVVAVGALGGLGFALLYAFHLR